MKGLETTELYINSPEEIYFGLRLGDYQGNSTITEVFFRGESIEGGETVLKIRGSIEREGLVYIFKVLSEILKSKTSLGNKKEN